MDRLHVLIERWESNLWMVTMTRNCDLMDDWCKRDTFQVVQSMEWWAVVASVRNFRVWFCDCIGERWWCHRFSSVSILDTSRKYFRDWSSVIDNKQKEMPSATSDGEAFECNVRTDCNDRTWREVRKKRSWLAAVWCTQSELHENDYHTINN